MTEVQSPRPAFSHGIKTMFQSRGLGHRSTIFGLVATRPLSLQLACQETFVDAKPTAELGDGKLIKCVARVSFSKANPL